LPPYVSIEYVNRRLTLLSLLVAMCLVVAGCGGPSSSKTDNSGIPAYATGADVQGQKQFASYWVDTVNTATVTGKTKKMKSLAAPSCTVCAQFAKKLDDIYGAGGNVKSKGWRIDSLIPIANQPKDNPGLQMNMAVSPQVVTAAKGQAAKTFKGGEVSWRFFMTRKDNHWLVQRLEV